MRTILSKQMLKVLVVIGFSFSTSVVFATGGGNIGTGGDWRRTMLEKAKHEAANWANSAAINPEVIERDSQLVKDSMTYRFVTHTGVLVQLATDIMTSHHIYNSEIEQVPGEYTSCAWTNDTAREKLTDIVFSLKLCEGGFNQGGQSYANRLLIHESVHHLLLNKNLRDVVGANFTGDLEAQRRAEDNLCDDIAEVIQRVFEAILLDGKTHWRDIAGPYNLGPKQVTLAERGFHASVWTGNTGQAKIQSKMIVWGGCNEGSGGIVSCGANGYLGDGGIYDPVADKWKLMSSDGAPSARAEMASLWTGPSKSSSLQNKFVIWGGCVDGEGCEKKLGDGAFYDPANDKWTAIGSSPRAPVARVHHSMVWTGERLIVWGGHPKDVPPNFSQPLNDGAAYNPDSKQWDALPPPQFKDGTTFAARGYQHASWTGKTKNKLTDSKMLIWGGCLMEVGDRCPQAFNDGALYDPVLKTWDKLVTTGRVPEARHMHSVVYVPQQQKIYIFGGYSTRGNILSDGGILDLNTLVWSPLANTSDGRILHSAVWAGDKLIIFGGLKAEVTGTTYESKVTAFVPSAQGSARTGSWHTFDADEATPLKTSRHSAFWIGDSMLVWGGQTTGSQFSNLGVRFFPGL